MLLATTNHVCQDLAVVPFLWVVPLALYLLSFIICFDHPRWYVRGLWITLAAVAILVAADPDIVFDKLAAGLHGLNARFRETILAQLLLGTGDLFLHHVPICMVCHGELMRLRPHPRRLTEYYLMMSAGGALGGVFVSLVAPLIFKSFFEWQLGLMLAFVVAAVAITLAAMPRCGPTLAEAGVMAGGASARRIPRPRGPHAPYLLQELR